MTSSQLYSKDSTTLWSARAVSDSHKVFLNVVNQLILSVSVGQGPKMSVTEGGHQGCEWFLSRAPGAERAEFPSIPLKVTRLLLQ